MVFQTAGGDVVVHYVKGCAEVKDSSNGAQSDPLDDDDDDDDDGDDDCSITVISKASISLNGNRPKQEEELKSCCVLSVVHSLQEKVMQLFFVWMMIFMFQTGSSEDLLKPFNDVMLALEGDNVTLSCNYSGSPDYFYWYQQRSSSSPKFLLSGYSGKTARLSFKQDTTTKEFHLQISSAAVSDSAVYYCAVRPFVTLFLLTIRGVSCEDLSPVNNEESSLEDSTVTLSYKYSKQAAVGDYFFWYRQYPGKPPEFLISHSATGKVTSNPVSRLTVKVSEDQTQMDLQISSAAVTDSALYYCWKNIAALLSVGL
ncbi:uncharacterized protein LOC121615600 [Chelmon rostratus]|uniref:uncharacterized protein LOC121615600 n=1 Tax=Chelmon rostratus TaxID=109905 RepID=UPI001BE618F1|nr:uncharacterized protein LOC121615600 [Chelmon rostratus]